MINTGITRQTKTRQHGTPRYITTLLKNNLLMTLGQKRSMLKKTGNQSPPPPD